MSQEELQEQLGAELPPAVAALPAADLGVLTELLATARREQAAALGEATEKGLGFIPRLLRGPVQKVLFR